MSVKNICKINLALSDQPLYISINNDDMSMDSIFDEAVTTLRDSGRAHESQQLAQLYQDHQIMSKGQMISKGSSFKELKGETREVNGQTINFAEVELIKQHVGGA